MKQIEYNSIMNQLSHNNSDLICGGELLSPQQTLEMLNLYNHDFLVPNHNRKVNEDEEIKEILNYDRDMHEDHKLIINSVVSPDH